MQERLRPYGALRAWAVMGGLWMALAPSAAGAAERHEVREGDLVLRSSLVARSELNPATAALNDIPSGKNRAVLKVGLLRASDEKSVRATVTAASRNQRGERQKILLREVLQGGETSYIGSFEFAPREELQFVVEARPAERKDSKPLSMSYVERMPPE